MLFFLLINVKMPTTVGNANNCWHFNIYEQEKIMLSWVEHDFFITLGHEGAETEIYIINFFA